MINISNFLDKFRILEKNKTVLKEKILEKIEKHSKVVLKKEDIEIKNSVIFVKSSPIKRAEIFFKKQDILEDFKKENIAINNII